MNPRNYAQLLYDALEDKSDSQQDIILKKFKDVLVRTKEQHLVLGIEKELNKIQEESRKKNTTYIASASDLTEGQKQDIESTFPKPREFSVNPNLLGGVAVRQGDKVFNATLRRKVEFLKSK